MKGAKYFESVTSAYNVLINPEKRKAYDLKLEGRSELMNAYTFPFRELGKWISSLNVYRIFFSGKSISKDPLPADPSILNLSTEELLQRIIFSNNSHVQLHAVRALLVKDDSSCYRDLLRLLYTGIHEDIKIEIISGLKNKDNNLTDRVLKEIYFIEKSEKIKNAIRALITI
jgi:hypothetical protein